MVATNLFEFEISRMRRKPLEIEYDCNEGEIEVNKNKRKIEKLKQLIKENSFKMELSRGRRIKALRKKFSLTVLFNNNFIVPNLMKHDLNDQSVSSQTDVVSFARELLKNHHADGVVLNFSIRFIDLREKFEFFSNLEHAKVFSPIELSLLG
jgi:hypothetical protein